MKLIEDIHHLYKLINSIKEKFEVINSNFFLMPSAINTYPDQNQMFWKMDANGLFLICEENDFYYLYYFLSMNPVLKGVDWFGNLHKPIIINHIFFESNKPKNLIEAEVYWMNVGFKNYRVNRRMTSFKLADESEKTRSKSKKENYYVDYAKTTDAGEILNLWRNNLDIYTSPLPTYNKIINIIEKRQMLGGYKKNNTLVAALQIGLIKNISYIDYLAVNQEYRRLGLAQALLDSYFSLPDKISRHFLWVNETNYPAIKLYKHNGFIFDGKISSQLILLQSSSVQ